MDDGSSMDYSQLPVLNQKQDLLRQQLAQSLAMLQRQPMQGYGVAGGVGAGLANLAQGLVGGLEAHNARQGLMDTTTQQAQLRRSIAQSLLGGPSQSSAAPQDMSPRLDATAGPAYSPGPHPLPISTPVREPNGMPAPVPNAEPAQGGAAPLSSGIDALAALGQRAMEDRQRGIALLATGDPTLSQTGAALLQQSQREQQMGFEGQQAQMGRQNALTIANKPQFHVNPYSQQAWVFHPDTGQYEVAAGGVSPGGDGGFGNSPADRMVMEQIQQLTDATNPAKVAPKLVEKLQFGDRIRPLIQQGLANGGSMTNEQATELASAFASYVANGGAPAEGQVRELLPPSLQGNLSRLTNFLTGGANGADRTAWLKILQQSLDREEPVIKGNVGQLLQHNLTGLASSNDPRYQTRRQAIEDELRQQGYLPPVQQSQSAAGMNLDAPVSAPAAHPQDSEAVQWAKAHPGDPRSARILQLNGVR